MITIGIPAEHSPGERRVAAVPQTVAAFVAREWRVVVETRAGDSAGFPDAAYEDAGAEIVPDSAAAHQADVVLRVAPTVQEVALMKSGSMLVGFLDPFVDHNLMAAAVDAGVSAIAVEAIPRTTLAQSMDALSSQATVGGYAAVLRAAVASPRFMPMLVTAAGTIAPARCLVLGVGVAGLQAIATARRLGAQVSAYDVREETKEQVESLGARFVSAPTQEADEGGYAKEVAGDMQARQLEVLAPHVAQSDLIITTAQIPGRTAPLLITTEMVKAMKPGSVIVDLAASTGGNVEPSKPEETVLINGVTILGPTNLPASVPGDASRMYSRNVQAIVDRMAMDGDPHVDLEDAIIGEACVVHGGAAVHARTKDLLGSEASS